MPGKGSPAMEFLKNYLRRRKHAEYAVVAAAAKAAGHKVYPVMYGRAQALLGHIPVRKRGTGPTARAKARMSAGRPARARRAAVSHDSLGGLKSLLSGYEALVKERNDLRGTLEEVCRIAKRSVG